MELIVKVNVKTIEQVDKKTNEKSKFDVYNTYIKDEQSGAWVKCNVKFKAGEEKPIADSYVYVEDNQVSINEMGNYPTIFINKVNRVKKLKFTNTYLRKYFKPVEEQKTDVNEVLDDKNVLGIDDSIFGEEVSKEDLPFDTDN